MNEIKLDQLKYKGGSDERMDKLVLLVFGECGTGKSTFLSLVSRIYTKNFLGANKEQPLDFKAAKSGSAVTTKVKVVQTGNLTLVDSPGTNDPNRKRTDQQIQIELFNTIRNMLKSQYDGINVFVQCIMPDAGGRIKRSAIESMCTMLLSLTSLYEIEDFDPKKHPRMCVVFNNVSKIDHPKKTVHKYGDLINDEKEETETEVTWKEYIVLYKKTLIEVLVETY